MSQIKLVKKKKKLFSFISDDTIPRHFATPLDKCTYKVHHVLGSLSNRRSSSDSSTLDLSGRYINYVYQVTFILSVLDRRYDQRKCVQRDKRTFV